MTPRLAAARAAVARVIAAATRATTAAEAAITSMLEAAQCLPRKSFSCQKLKACKPIKQACSKAARRKKYAAYLVDTSDEEDDEFVGGK